MLLRFDSVFSLGMRLFKSGSLSTHLVPSSNTAFRTRCRVPVVHIGRISHLALVGCRLSQRLFFFSQSTDFRRNLATMCILISGSHISTSSYQPLFAPVSHGFDERGYEAWRCRASSDSMWLDANISPICGRDAPVNYRHPAWWRWNESRG